MLNIVTEPDSYPILIYRDPRTFMVMKALIICL